MKKYYIVAVLVFCLLCYVGFLTSYDVRAMEREPYISANDQDKESVPNFGFMERIGAIKFESFEALYPWPSSGLSRYPKFQVLTDETIIVIDNADNCLLKIFNETIIEKIELPSQDKPIIDFVFLDDNIYLMNQGYEIMKLQKFNENNFKLLNTTKLEENINMQPFGFIKCNGEVFLQTLNNEVINIEELFVGKDSYNKILIGGKDKLSISGSTIFHENFVLHLEGEKEIVCVYFMGSDAEGNIYINYMDMWMEAPSAYIIAERIIRKLSPQGDILGSFVVPHYGLTPEPWATVDDQGNVYLMIFTENHAEIHKVTLGKELPACDFEEIIRKKSSQHQDNSISESEYSIQSMTRTLALDRARNMIYLQWVFLAKNANNPDPNNVWQPRYLRDTNYGTTLTGIPYCYGGFDGVDTSHSYSVQTNFLDAMNRGIFAGNIKASGGWKTGTAGLDCSGFVSSTINLPSHNGTVSLWDNHSFQKSLSNRQCMDIFIHRTNHVLFYHSDYYEINGIYSMESTTDGGYYDKVKWFSRTFSWLNSNGYSLRGLNVFVPPYP